MTTASSTPAGAASPFTPLGQVAPWAHSPQPPAFQPPAFQPPAFQPPSFGPTRAAPATGGSGAHRGLTLAVVCAAIFMLVLDVTIVSVALAELQRDLGAGFDDLQWVVDAYTLALAGGLLTAATLGDRIGRKRVFAAGLGLFSVASLACAFSTTVGQLFGARAVQGLGAALLFGTALPLLGAAFAEGHGRDRAVGAFGASMAAATAVGPLIGGALVDGPGWRWIFLINVPVGAVALVATLAMAESRSRSARRADWPGAVLLTASLLCLLLALIRGNSSGWGSLQILGLFVGAGLLIVAFALREATAPEPMLDLHLLARPAFAGAALQAFALGATLIAATFYLALYLQNTLGFSPLGTGLRVLPLTVAAFVAALGTAAVLRRTGARLPLALGLFVGADGLALVAWAGPLLATGPDRSWALMTPGFVLAGIGLGSGLASSASAALATVGPEHAGMATGTITTVRQVGVAAGVAALGALFQHRAGRIGLENLPAALRGRVADAVAAGAGTRVVDSLPVAVPAATRTAVAAAAREASTGALELLLLGSAAVGLLCGLVCVVLLGLLRGRP